MRGIDDWQSPAGDLDTLLRELPTTDALVVLGGDGTFLRAARAVAEVDVPLLGINLGKVGFLSKAEAADLETGARTDRRRASSRSTSGWSSRAGSCAAATDPDEAERHVALNDIVVARGALARVCRLDVSRSTTRTSRRSSPTASWSRARPARPGIRSAPAARSSIPVSRNLVVTPIAAYLSALRSVVASPEQVVRCRVVDAHEALVSIDGREDLPIAVGDVVEVRALERPIRLLHPRGALLVLGPAPPQGGAAAVVTETAATPGRLLELTVSDLALIDRLRLEFDAGLNVITGETGAGKSLLIDALGLAMGARADTTLVRHGAEAARVEALFDRLPEPLIAVRDVAASGRSTARIDDAAVTAARLAEEVGALVEVHGQNDQGRLLDERWQRDLLDGFGGHGELRQAMADGRRALAREPGGARCRGAGPARGGPPARPPRARGVRDRGRAACGPARPTRSAAG